MNTMKTKDMAISAGVEASLITVHSRRDCIEEAERLLETWKSKGHSTLTAAYANILLAYAERGWSNKIIQV